jgi:hypothetical protein
MSVILSDERSEESKDPYSIHEGIAVPRLVAALLARDDEQKMGQKRHD